MYGLTSRYELEQHIKSVVSVIGGGIYAENLLIETAAAETDLGKQPDHTWNTGIGIMQFDHIGFIDVQQRTNATIKRKVFESFGVDIDKIKHTDLRYSPLASVIFARLKYRLISSSIPRTIQGRAAYWKKWYNSELGAGTPEHYLSMAALNGLV